MRVVKRKWDGSVSAIEVAHLLDAPGGTWVWSVPTGSRRDHPGTGETRIVDREELWLAVPGEWWVMCAYLDGARTVTGFMIHATAPFEVPGGEEVLWIDLDLDFEITGEEVAVRDETQFHQHARAMAYPAHVVDGAWSSMSTIAARYTNGEWPFDGSVQKWADSLLPSA